MQFLIVKPLATFTYINAVHCNELQQSSVVQRLWYWRFKPRSAGSSLTDGSHLLFSFFSPNHWQPSLFFILFPKPLAIFTAFSVLQVHTIYRFLLTLCYVMLLNVLSLITRFFAKIISSCGSSVVRAFVIRRRPGCRFSGSWVRIPHHNTRCALGPS